MAELESLYLNDMAIFAQVVERGSFTGAGRQLGLPKSTVSRRVSRLESKLGVRLLNRTTRALQPTELGSAYYSHCARMVAEAREAEAEVTDLQLEPTGTLRISVGANFGIVIAPLLSRFLQAHERIRVDLICTDRLVDLVSEGVDFAFRFGTLPDSSLVARKLTTSKGMLCASPAYLARAGEPRTLQDLQHHTCIHYGLGPRDHLWRFHGEQGMETVDAVARLALNDFATMCEAVIAGLGIAALPQMLFEDALVDGRVVPILTQWRFREVDLHLVYLGGRHVPRRMRAFIDFAADWFANNPTGRATLSVTR